MADYSGIGFQVCSEAPPVGNPSFEIAGTSPGEAASWVFTFQSSLEAFLAFDTTAAPREDFDSEWRLPNTGAGLFNEDSKFSFVDATDLTAAQFAGIDREEFEFGWDNDAGFLDDLDALTTDDAEFDGLAFISGTASAPFTLSVGHLLRVTTDVGGPADSDAIAAAIATVAGAGGTFPTGFVGGEQIQITLDGGTLATITFQAGDQTAILVRDRINTFLPGAAAENAGEVDISGSILGTDGSVLLADVTAGALATIGHVTGTTAGTGNVANLAAGVTAVEVVTIVNGSVALQAINVEARTTEDSVRVFSTTTAAAAIEVATNAMATAITFDPLDTTISASGLAQQDVEDLEGEWGFVPNTTTLIGNEIAKGGLEDFVDSTASPPFGITAGANDTFFVDFDQAGSSSITGTIASGTYNTVAAMATALQAAFDAALDPGPGDPGDLVAEEGPSGALRVRTAVFTRFRVRKPASDSAWTTLGFVEFEALPRDYHFQWLQTTALAAAAFDVALDLYEDYEQEWRDNEDSKFSFVGPPTDLEFASFDPVPQDFEDFEDNWTLML